MTPGCSQRRHVYSVVEALQEVPRASLVATVGPALAELPLPVVFQIASWLKPEDSARMVATHMVLGEAQDDLAVWVSREALAVDLNEIRARRGGTWKRPMLRLLVYVHRRCTATARARRRTIGAGLRHCIAVCNGIAHGWGSAALGTDAVEEVFLTAARVIPFPEPITLVACGGDHSVFLTATGAAFAFGRNEDGQLGNGTRAASPLPSLMEVPLVVQAACGADHTLLLAGDKGSVWACGRGIEGQLGFPVPDHERHALYPTRIGGGLLDGASLIACGADYSVVLDGAGRVFCFGENSKGQLGLGHRQNRCMPEVAHLPAALAVHADCGGMHTLIVADDFRVFGCGGNDLGQLGVGATTDRFTFSPVSILAPGAACHASHVSCGFGHSMLLTLHGVVWLLGSRPPANPCNCFPVAPWRINGELERDRVDDVVSGGGHALFTADSGIFGFCVASPSERQDEGDGEERSGKRTLRRLCV
eukprot:NODE_6052_length_1710_cov_4.651295.p1 GENE.NODE_6052_length_1710_cov_4.651295~~NODE_6052_length_1710_cov_4.651295.p1  ORF type:complete len:525 (-),score=114.57 NODE_6052_length_1710_cov_4.651295:134-1564(-)